MKIASLQLNGYRGFESYALKDLARVNLLVGKNNSGKTSVLEAISLLTENGGLPALARSAIQRRQEKFWFTDNQRNIDIFDISPVFFGYRMTPNTRFTVTSNLNQMSMEMVPINKIESSQMYSDPEIQDVERNIGETAFIGLKIAASSLNYPHSNFSHHRKRFPDLFKSVATKCPMGDRLPVAIPQHHAHVSVRHTKHLGEGHPGTS